MSRTGNVQLRSSTQHDFSIGSAPSIRRSRFDRPATHKTTMNSGILYPIYTDEILPGDSVSMDTQAYVRMTTPIFPVMDNCYIDFQWWFVAMRHVWDNSRKFFGEQDNPTDSVDYVIPQVTGVVGEGQIGHYILGGFWAHSVSVSALYFRGYTLIYNEHYRDQDLIASKTCPKGDGPDAIGIYNLHRRGKRHDYFTSGRPWPLKGGQEVPIPLGSSAPVFHSGDSGDTVDFAAGPGNTQRQQIISSNQGFTATVNAPNAGSANLFADLENADAGGTVNQLRQVVQVQRMLERDARFGTRYPEHLKSHFDVDFYDVSYRPLYLGGGSKRINITPIAQTGATDQTSPQGNLAAVGTAAVGGIGFSRSFNEHGMIFCIASIRCDLTYQQGIDRRFSRTTRYDFFYPTLAHLGEQAVLQKEIFADGTNDDDVFCYQERNAEYRYAKNMVSGKFSSKAAQTLHAWHYAQEFSQPPKLDSDFINENPPVARTLAVQNQPEFIADFRFNGRWARPIPMRGTPGMMDHF